MWKFLRRGLTLAGLTAVLLGCDKDFDFGDLGGKDNGSNNPNNQNNWPNNNPHNHPNNRPNNIDVDHKGVVSIINATNVNIKFSYKWEGAGNWQQFSLPPNGSFYQYRNPTLDGRYQLLEVRFDNKASAGQNQAQIEMLAPERWRGQGQPQFRDGRLYKFVRFGNNIKLVLG